VGYLINKAYIAAGKSILTTKLLKN